MPLKVIPEIILGIMAKKKHRNRRAKIKTRGNQHASENLPLPDQAIEAHKSGDLAKAESLYLSFLQQFPDHGRCAYLLGLLYSQKGDLAQAVRYMATGLTRDPHSPTGHNNLGTVYLRLHDLERAKTHFKTALEQDPQLVAAALNLGSIYQKANRLPEAEACFRKALAIERDSAEACVNLGGLLRQKGMLEEAEKVLRHGIGCVPELASAHNNLGVVLHEQSRLKEAFMAFKRALELDDGYVDAYNNMGSVFRDQNQLDAALACYDKALALDETWANAHNNKGAVLQTQGKLGEAELHFRRAVGLKPDFPPALVNLGTVLHKLGHHKEARSLYEQAIEIDPDYPQAHFGLAELLLYTDPELTRGWQEHFWRWKKPELVDQWRPYSCPYWQGEPLAGKTIWVWGEQGIGEEIMYATMIPDLLEQGARVHLECDARLVPLFARSYPEMTCWAREDWTNLPEQVDFHCATADLGQWLRPDFAAFPAEPKPLEPNQAVSADLRKRYKALGEGPVIGLSWSSTNPEMGWEKSIDLEAWLPVLTWLDKAVFVDLQYGDTARQRADLEQRFGVHLYHDNTIDQLKDLDAFAAQVAAMDLVLSISNSTVHVAGALAVPTWCLLSSAPLWRWFKHDNCSRWYPSVKFYRQNQRANWTAVIRQVANDLKGTCSL